MQRGNDKVRVEVEVLRKVVALVVIAEIVEKKKLKVHRVHEIENLKVDGAIVFAHC